jgi:hypothetical protein
MKHCDQCLYLALSWIRNVSYTIVYVLLLNIMPSLRDDGLDSGFQIETCIVTVETYSCRQRRVMQCPMYVYVNTPVYFVKYRVPIFLTPYLCTSTVFFLRCILGLIAW